MNIESPRISRRLFIRIAGGAFLYSIAPSRFSGIAAEPGKGFIAEASSSKESCDAGVLTRKLFESAGGMSRFVSRGDVVVIKPNRSWARAPQLAATKHPDVLETVARKPAPKKSALPTTPSMKPETAMQSPAPILYIPCPISCET